jgi:hypothetical protein
LEREWNETIVCNVKVKCNNSPEGVAGCYSQDERTRFKKGTSGMQIEASKAQATLNV